MAPKTVINSVTGMVDFTNHIHLLNGKILSIPQDVNIFTIDAGITQRIELKGFGFLIKNHLELLKMLTTELIKKIGTFSIPNIEIFPKEDPKKQKPMNLDIIDVLNMLHKEGQRYNKTKNKWITITFSNSIEDVINYLSIKFTELDGDRLPEFVDGRPTEIPPLSPENVWINSMRDNLFCFLTLINAYHNPKYVQSNNIETRETLDEMKYRGLIYKIGDKVIPEPWTYDRNSWREVYSKIIPQH